MHKLRKLKLLDFIQFLIEEGSLDITAFKLRDDGSAMLTIGDDQDIIPVYFPESYTGIYYIRFRSTIYAKPMDAGLDREWVKLMKV